MQVSAGKWVASIIGVSACVLLRLVPFRPPNIEPILAVQMPFAKAYGKLTGFIFGFSSVILFDLITGTVGVWTLITAATYGFLGILAGVYFAKRANSIRSYVSFAIVSTVIYDVITGFSIGPIFFGQSFVAAVVGQIPFTLWHCIGNVSFALVLSPALYRYVIENKRIAVWSASLLPMHHA